MQRIASNRIGVDQGSSILFSDFEDGGKMWTGHGPREARKSILFAEPFKVPPVVTVGISMWDLDQKSNQRSDIAAERITETGFDIVFKTWGDTRVARIRADWVAFGAVKDDEDWEIL